MNENPIHYLPLGEYDHDGWKTPGWYFWVETWADRCGPYATEAEARMELNRYCKEVLGD